MKKISQILLLPYLVIKREFYWAKAIKSNLPGKNFFEFGTSIALKIKKQLILSKDMEFPANMSYDPSADPERLYALINDDKDFVLIQYYVFDRILRTINYFIK